MKLNFKKLEEKKKKVFGQFPIWRKKNTTNNIYVNDNKLQNVK